MDENAYQASSGGSAMEQKEKLQRKEKENGRKDKKKREIKR